MRIGIMITNKHDGKGGVETVMLRLVEELQKQGHFCKLYMTDETRDPTFMSSFSHLFLARRPPHFLERKSFLRPRALFNYYYRRKYTDCFREIENDKLDILLLASITAVLVSKYIPWESFLDKNHMLPIVAYPHITSVEEFAMNPKLISFLNRLDGFLAISPDLAKEYVEHNVKLPTHLIYNPIPGAVPTKRSGSPIRFVYLGRLAPKKRILQLLQILSRLKGNWHADFVGAAINQDYEKAIQNTIFDLDLTSKITLHGWQENPWDCLSDASAVLLHSEGEGFPLVLGEAMMRGIPCVSADCPTGPANIIQNGVNGWLYEMNDEKTCQQILQEIIDGTRILPPIAQVCESVQHLRTDQMVNNMVKAMLEIIKHKKTAQV